ncbi:hypothetical protein SS50377_23301 [Spironucleus salmonicida]|uniref:Uncharacterized protein n=1 Tax=Spironucleus salmonicida TaxID=348837 RepID=V6LRI6_9EUKA|nr:hypothetical protein SS50377_23301 [Spironucleus salmonicida]|eukprot:EST47170.1 Hypothetical protein SS50377_12681 [Spironucleus salmonicida]
MPTLSKEDIVSTITAAVMLEYEEYLETYGNQSVLSNDLRNLSHDISNEMSNFSIRSVEFQQFSDISYIDGELSIQLDDQNKQGVQEIDKILGIDIPKIDPEILQIEEKLIKWTRIQAKDIIKQLIEDQGEANNDSFEIS